MSSDPTSDEQWYWDLSRGIAVRANERGPGANTMGPYPSKAEAERWQERVDERNEAWADDDEAWEGTDAPDAGTSDTDRGDASTSGTGPDGGKSDGEPNSSGSGFTG